MTQPNPPTDQDKKRVLFKMALAQVGIADPDADELIAAWPNANPDEFVNGLEGIARILELDEPPNLIQPTEEPWKGIHAKMLTSQDMPAAFAEGIESYSDLLVLAISNAIHARQQAVRQKAAKKGSGPTDDVIAHQWKTEHRDTVFGLGEFRRYKDGIWNALPGDLAKQEMKAVMLRYKQQGLKPTASKLASALELARIDIFIRDETWDTRPDLLACINGTLHIPTLTLQPHSPADYLLSGVPYPFDPTAPAPAWEAFLVSTLPIDVIEFLQEFAGYCLTTDTRYELAIWLYGPGGSGKSTFLVGLQAMLGSRAEILGLSDIERSNFALSNLPGKTLMVSTEQPAMFMKSVGTINALISGEPVTVDRKYLSPITLAPKVKLAWAMNEFPRVPEAGSGLFRRVKVIEFPRRNETDQDPEVKEAIKAEGPGILNWALIGLQRLQARKGFRIPQSIRDATTEFQLSNDVPAMFIAERCYIGQTYKVSSIMLYNSYSSWCISNGHKPQSSTSIATDWKRLGFVGKHTMNGRVWEGVDVRP